MEEIEKFGNARDEFNSQYTIFAYDTPRQTVVDQLAARIDLLQSSCTDAIKRSYLVGKLAGLRNKLASGPQTEKINRVFLLDKDDTIHEVDLTEAHVKVAREWGVNKFAIKWGEYFDIAWIKDLFTVSEGRHVLQLKGNSVSHHVITTAKRKTLFNEEIKSFDVGGYFGPEGWQVS